MASSPGGPQPKRRCVICHASYERGERFCSLDGGAVIDEAVDDPLVGKTIDDRYLVRRFIGRGGMGAVYEAEHVGLDKRVALKVIANDDASGEERARFRQEARSASRVVHEHVVQIFDVGADAGRDYIVMEYVEGRDLHAVLQAGPLEPGRAAAIARQVLEGLHAIHEAGIVHRDIKPPNIVLAGDTDFVKLMDFGIAKSFATEVAQTETGTNRVVGTPEFMAPEQLAGEPLDRRSDLYAVGVTLFAMLTGEMPFPSFTKRVTELARPAPSLESVRPGLPPELVATVARALEVSPERRFADALEFAAALGDTPEVAPPKQVSRPPDTPTVAARPSRPPAEKPPAEAPPAEAPTGRSRAPLLIGLAFLVGVSGTLGYKLVHRAPSVVAPAPVVAADAAVADKLAIARAAEQRGELALAIEAYREAYAATPSPDLLYRIGDLYARIGDRAQAAAYLRRYLDSAPAAPDRDAVAARIAGLAPPAPVEAPPIDAGVDHTPVVTHPPKPPPIAAKEDGPVCVCTSISDEQHPWTQNLARSRLAHPVCQCLTSDRDLLCSVPYVGWDNNEHRWLVASDGGEWRCVDLKSPGCDISKGDVPGSCDRAKRTGVVDGQACSGHLIQGREGTGTIECEHRLFDKDFHGVDDGPCEGFGQDGTRYRGKLRRCSRLAK